jgi:hypothetical protein
MRSKAFVVMAVTLALAGCATGLPDRDASPAAAIPPVPEAIRSLAGQWEGGLWETPAASGQGQGALRLSLADDGTWRGTVKGRPASGTIVRRGTLVVLLGTVTAPGGGRQLVYYSLTRVGDTLWGMTIVPEGNRSAGTAVHLRRVP